MHNRIIHDTLTPSTITITAIRSDQSKVHTRAILSFLLQYSTEQYTTVHYTTVSYSTTGHPGGSVGNLETF